MRFRAEFDMRESDCSWCPCFNRTANDEAECNLAYVLDDPYFILKGVLVPSGKRPIDVIVKFPIPIDCPLEAVADAVPESRL